MRLVKYIANRFLRSREPSPAKPAAPSVPSVRDGVFDLLGSTDPRLGVSTVYSCVKLLSDSVAQLPLRYMRLRDGVFTPDTNHRLHYLLTVQPDYFYSAFDFWSRVVYDLLLQGNCYIVPRYGFAADGSPMVERLALCRPHCVNYSTITDTYTINDADAAVSGDFCEDEVIHIKGMGTEYDPRRGMSVLSYARMSLMIAGAGDRETLNRIRYGGNVRGIISNNNSVQGFGEYADEELERTADAIDSELNDEGRQIVATPGAVSFTQLSMSSVDLQFLESRKFTVAEICRFFRVHPSMVFHDSATNYKSAEMANAAFLNNTLNPILRKIESELLRKLVSPTLATKRRFSFDRMEISACDLSSRVQYQAASLAAGLSTVNELRASEGRCAVDGGDAVLVSANLRPIDALAAAPATTSPAATEGEGE